MNLKPWSFEPSQAPMRANCPTCQRSVSVVRPRVADIAEGRYLVHGECKECGSELALDIA